MKQYLTPRNLVILIGVLVFALAIYLFANNSDSSDQTEVQTGETVLIDPEANLNQEVDEQPIVEEEPQQSKPAGQTAASVLKRPVVSTGFGHSPDNPLKEGQTTSTTCTTDALVDCQVEFRNSETGDIIQFPAKATDGDGVAFWQWTGGDDIPSGTWEVTARAADKSSDAEVVYVQ